MFGGKMGVAATVAPRGLGPQDPTKKLAHWVDLLGRPLSRKHLFEIFGPEPTLPLRKNVNWNILFLCIFVHKIIILAWYSELQITHSHRTVNQKYLVPSKSIDIKISLPYWYKGRYGHSYLAITQPCLGQLGWFYMGDYYLLISNEKSGVWNFCRFW